VARGSTYRAIAAPSGPLPTPPPDFFDSPTALFPPPVSRMTAPALANLTQITARTSRPLFKLRDESVRLAFFQVPTSLTSGRTQLHPKPQGNTLRVQTLDWSFVECTPLFSVRL
jgi:hypothetical protein